MSFDPEVRKINDLEFWLKLSGVPVERKGRTFYQYHESIGENQFKIHKMYIYFEFKIKNLKPKLTFCGR